MAMNEEQVSQFKQIESHAINGISWKTIAIISLAVSGVLFLLILALVTRRPMLPPQPLGPLMPVTTQSDMQQDAVTPIPTSEEIEKINAITFPSDAFFLSTGEATVKSLSQNFETNKEVVELNLSFFGTDEEKSYTITMPAHDAIYEPKISFQEKYACFTISTSGYSGYYIFKLPDGEHIDVGKQYSSCVTWIDDHRVIIADKPYFNPEQTTFYILDAETNTKQIISSPLQLK